MFCKNCGKESDGTKKFCTNCGKELPHATKANPTPIPPHTPPVFATSRHWNWRPLIGIAIFLALIGWGAYSSLDDDAIETNNNAITNYDSGNSQQAISQFEDASKSAVSTENKINTLKNLAYVYSSEGQDDQAISTFQQALALTSEESFDYYLISGEIALLQGKPTSAQIAYNKAYQLDPNDFQINNALALFYLDMNDVATQYADVKKGLQYAQRAAQLTDLQIAKQNLGIAYYMNDMYPQAISTLSALTLDADGYTAYWLGLSYAGNDDSVNAKIYLRKAIAGGVDVPQEVYDYINSH